MIRRFSNYNKLTVAVGYASIGDHANATLEELTSPADKRMYENKKAFYSIAGNDRRKR